MSLNIDSIKKNWVWFLGGILLLGLFFNESFRHTISRRIAIKKAQSELAAASKEAEELQKKITQLENKPSSYENLARKELGYLKPGEKEVRFIPAKK